MILDCTQNTSKKKCDSDYFRCFCRRVCEVREGRAIVKEYYVGFLNVIDTTGAGKTYAFLQQLK